MSGSEARTSSPILSDVVTRTIAESSRDPNYPHMSNLGCLEELQQVKADFILNMDLAPAFESQTPDHPCLTGISISYKDQSKPGDIVAIKTTFNGHNPKRITLRQQMVRDEKTIAECTWTYAPANGVGALQPISEGLINTVKEITIGEEHRDPNIPKDEDLSSPLGNLGIFQVIRNGSMSDMGIDFEALVKAGFYPFMVKQEAMFAGQVNLGDTVQIRTNLTITKNLFVTLQQQMIRDGEIMTELTCTYVLVDDSDSPKAQRISDSLIGKVTQPTAR